MAFRSASSPASGTGTSATVAVPTGAAVGDIAVVGLVVYNTTDADSVILAGAQAGFALKGNAQGTLAQGARGRLFVFWKRLTAADTGNYVFSWTTSNKYQIAAELYSGRVTVGDPWCTDDGSVTVSGATASTTLAATGVTVTVAGCDVVGICAFAGTSGGAFTPPSGMTERVDTGSDYLTAVDLENQATGATGSKTFTWAGGGITAARAFLGALMPDDGRVMRRDILQFAPSATTAYTPGSLPTHVTGDKLVAVVTGKTDSTTVPTINQSWVLTGSGTGGTGAAAADTGPMFWASYEKIATSASETPPTFTPGGTAPNSWGVTIASYALGTGGGAWADTPATSAGWVQGISDTTTTTPLTGTASAFTNQPTAGDAILAVGAVPTDGGGIFSSFSMSATGLSDGAQRNGGRQLNSLGNDSAQLYGDWVGFTGTASSGVTASLANNSGDHSGVIVAIALRQGAAPVTGTSAVAPSVALSTTGTAQGSVAVSPSPAIATTGGTSGSVAVAAAVAIATTGALIFTGTSAVSPSVSIATTGELGVPGTVDVAVGTAIATTGRALGTSAVAPSVAIATTGTLAGTVAVAPVVSLATTGRALGTSSVTVAVTISTTGGLRFTGTSAVAPSVTIETTGALSVPPIVTDTSNRDDGLDLDGTALVEWEPAVVATPAALAGVLAYDTARAIEKTGIGPAGQPLITTQDAIAPRTRDRILIGGVDFTYYRNVKTPTPDYRLIKPLLWGSATLVLPQINPQYELLGTGATGALRRIKDGAIVVVQRVSGSTIVATDYVGFIDAINTSGSTLSLSLGGHASGRASRDDVPPPVFRKRHDIKFQVLNYLRTLNVRTTRGGDIGITLYDRGGSDGLSHVNEMVSLAVTATGVQYDVTPTTGRIFDMVETDRETIAATAYLDDSLVTQQLDRAFSEEPNVVYATGRTQNGQVVNGMRSPGLVQGVAPTFPGLLQLGDESADVALLRDQLSIHGALNYDDAADPDLFDVDLEGAVSALQFAAGILPLTGEVDEDTWKAAWNLDLGGGFSIDRTRIFPLAWRNYTHKWYFSANGSKLRRNPNWDPHRIKTAVSYGDGLTGFNRRRIIRFSESKLAPQNVSNWQGTITLSSAVIAGEHTPGDPITAADVMPARSLRPGMNLWLPLFDGGTLFHISGVDVSNDGANVSLIVDTQARDTMAAWEAITRNRETRSNPARAWSGHTRRSSVQQDSIAEWTDICGNLAHKIALTGAGWTEVMTPAGQEGVVQSVRMQLDNPDEFAVIVSQKSIGLGMLNARVAAPLTAPPPDPQRHRIVVTGTPTGGTFTLSGNSNTTSALAYNVAAPALQTAIRSLGGNLSNATVARGDGGAFVVTMHGSEEDIDLGTNSLTGGDSPSVSVTSTAASAGDGTPWYEQEVIRKWLDSRGVLDAWGTPQQPCGYDPGLKTNESGPTAQAITGLFHEQAGLNYSAAHPGRLYLYVWTWSDNFLLPGRVLTQQLTPGA